MTIMTHVSRNQIPEQSGKLLLSFLSKRLECAVRIYTRMTRIVLDSTCGGCRNQQGQYAKPSPKAWLAIAFWCPEECLRLNGFPVEQLKLDKHSQSLAQIPVVPGVCWLWL